MSYLMEAATEIHLPAPHRGLTARLQSVREHESGVVTRMIDEPIELVPSDRYLWAAVSAVGVGLSILAMNLVNRLAKVTGTDPRTR